ncbi:unnamed protein product [Calypogeia fissa]
MVPSSSSLLRCRGGGGGNKIIEETISRAPSNNHNIVDINALSANPSSATAMRWWWWHWRHLTESKSGTQVLQRGQHNHKIQRPPSRPPERTNEVEEEEAATINQWMNGIRRGILRKGECGHDSKY